MEQLIVEKRIVDSRRRTIAYIIDGKRVTKGKVVQLARRGKLKGVAPRHGVTGWYIAAKPSADRQLGRILTIVEK
jgi:hypothetical protein